MYIHNSWLHVRLLNRQSKREKRVEQEGRYSLCPAVKRSSVGTYIQKKKNIYAMQKNLLVLPWKSDGTKL
jgi:hypothetical protein